MALDLIGMENYSFGYGLGKNCIIFGADLSSSPHANNKKNNILVLEQDFVQGIQKNCIKSILLKKIVSACIIMEQTVIHLLMVQKSISLKQKTLRL